MNEERAIDPKGAKKARNAYWQLTFIVLGLLVTILVVSFLVRGCSPTGYLKVSQLFVPRSVDEDCNERPVRTLDSPDSRAFQLRKHNIAS